MKNCKVFYEASAATHLKEIIQLPPNPPPTRLNLTKSLEQNFSYGDIQKYTDICFQSASRMQFWSVKKWCSANVFSDIKQKHACWKTCKVREVFGCILCSMSSELRFIKCVRFFEWNCLVKLVILGRFSQCFF